MIKPSPILIDSYLNKWDSLENYTLQEKSLGLLFNEFCLGNTKLEYVLLKVTALNQFYSTRIFDTYSVAKHILKMDVDQRLERRDCSLVNELALITIKGKQINFYSFASKYCSHHVPEAFPIYDSFVEKMLWHYVGVDNFTSFKKAELKQYARYVQIIAAFREFYGLENFSLRQIDIFLWLAGKEFFPPKHSKKSKNYLSTT
jgi:hypothetical protein